jgi:hypothetical protein
MTASRGNVARDLGLARMGSQYPRVWSGYSGNLRHAAARLRNADAIKLSRAPQTPHNPSKHQEESMREAEHEQQSTRRGFFPVVVGRDVSMQNAGGAVLIAKHDLKISRGGGQWLVAGRDQSIEQGGGAFLLSRRARVTNGFVGVIVAGRVTLEGTARTLLTVSGGAIAAVAAAFGLGLLFGERRGKRRRSASVL